MNVELHIESIQRQLLQAAEAGGDDARVLAERLIAPLDAAIRLALQDMLSEAVDEITCELAPGSVELRLRGRDLELVVNLPAIDLPDDDRPERSDPAFPIGQAVTGITPPVFIDGDEGTMSRINLRMTDHLKARVEQAASSDGLSVNAWLVRAAAAALERTSPDQVGRRAPYGAQHYIGWAR